MTRSAKALLICTGLLCSLCLGSPALADDVKIVPSVPYREQFYPVTLFELAGVRLGMTRDEVQARAAQGDVEGKPFLDTATLSLTGPSAKVQSEPYLNRISIDIKPNAGNLRVMFSVPSIGDRVVALAFIRLYSDLKAAPSVGEVLEQFEAKYGKSVRVHLPAPDEWATREDWFFSATGPVPCGGSYCLANAASGLHNIPRLIDSTSGGERVIVSVFLITHKADPTRVESVSVNIEDVANELLALTEARKQLEAALPKAP